jgi:transposase
LDGHIYLDRLITNKNIKTIADIVKAFASTSLYLPTYSPDLNPIKKSVLRLSIGVES